MNPCQQQRAKKKEKKIKDQKQGSKEKPFSSLLTRGVLIFI